MSAKFTQNEQANIASDEQMEYARSVMRLLGAMNAVLAVLRDMSFTDIEPYVDVLVALGDSMADDMSLLNGSLRPERNLPCKSIDSIPF